MKNDNLTDNEEEEFDTLSTGTFQQQCSWFSRVSQSNLGKMVNSNLKPKLKGVGSKKAK